MHTQVTYSNGRVEWEASKANPDGRGGWMHHDRRTFAPDEIEIIEED